MAALHEQLTALMRDVADLKRRADTTVRHGKVAKVDAEKHRVKLTIGGTEKEPQESPWVPYGQIAGALKVHTPPSVGQQMTLFAPTGDFRQAVALPLTWSDENKSPSDKPDEHVLTFENVKIVVKKDSVKLSVGDASIEVTKDSILAVAKEMFSSKVGDAEIEQKGDATNIVAAKLHTVGKTYLGVDGKGETPADKVEVETDIPSKNVFAKK
jgi:phage baseplate assembly protein V